MNQKKDFNSVIAQVHPRVYKYCYSQLKKHDLADEATHMVMVTVSDKWKSLEVGDEFEAYCINVAKNCIKQVRYMHNRYYSKHESLEELSENGALDHAYTTDSCCDDPEDKTEEYIEQIKRSLPYEESRQLFVYRYIEKNTLYEISDLTGISYTPIRRRLSRIEKLVRKEIEKIFK